MSKKFIHHFFPQQVIFFKYFFRMSVTVRIAANLQALVGSKSSQLPSSPLISVISPFYQAEVSTEQNLSLPCGLRSGVRRRCSSRPPGVHHRTVVPGNVISSGIP
jgi:hypothetical protein